MAFLIIVGKYDQQEYLLEVRCDKGSGGQGAHGVWGVTEGESGIYFFGEHRGSCYAKIHFTQEERFCSFLTQI